MSDRFSSDLDQDRTKTRSIDGSGIDETEAGTDPELN